VAERLRRVARLAAARDAGGWRAARERGVKRPGLPEARLGLIPGAGGTQRLTRLCGRPVAARLILGAEIISGASARELGVIQWAVPRSELSAAAADIARRVAALPAAALACSKACIAAAGEPGDDGFRNELECTRELLTNTQTRERVQAFLSRAMQSS